jgi:hypothetical protein
MEPIPIPGDKLNFTIITKPIVGTIAAFDAPSGTVTYRPPIITSQAGDSFAYRVNDNHGA